MRALNLLLVVSLWGLALWGWPRIPDTIPLHFGADGRPDRWGPASAFNWFLLPAMALGLNALVMFLRQRMGRTPGLVKLPGGQTLADLDASARPRVLAAMTGFLGLVQAELNVIVLLVQYGQLRAALGGDAQPVIWSVILLGLLSGPALIVVYFLRLQRALSPKPPRP